MTGASPVHLFIVFVLLLAGASSLFLSARLYRVKGNLLTVEPGSVTTPLGRFSFQRSTRLVIAETKRGKLEFAAKPPVSILAVPSTEQAIFTEFLSGNFGYADLLPAFRDSNLTLMLGLRSESRFLPLLALSQHRIADVLHGSDPPHLTLIRALRLYRDVHDVATETRATFIEAFREMGLEVHFDEGVG